MRNLSGQAILLVFFITIVVGINVYDKQPPPANMNGQYLIANPNRQAPVSFSTDYTTKNAEYFDVYSLPIRTVYGEVYWTMQDPVPLPKEIVERFSNKTMATIGYEADQVFITSNGEVSVPIYWSYNHHYCAWLLGENVKMVHVVGTTPMDGAYNHGSSIYWKALSTEPMDPVFPIPDSQFFSEGNGGEYRKSFHGYPKGYAQLIKSPVTFQIQPMQIDTHNRDYHGAGFKAGLLPKASQAPPNATYSGLLECPCTTRIQKTWNEVYSTRYSATCPTAIANASQCVEAIDSFLQPTNTYVVSDPALPTGCMVIHYQNGTVNAIFNKQNTSTNCSGGKMFAASTSSVVHVEVLLDTTVPEGRVIINMTGPANVWFGVGFDATAMANQPYVVVIDGNGKLSEHKIGDHAPGTLLSPTQASIMSSTVVGNVRTVVLSRAFKGMTKDHYSFDSTNSRIPIIDAIGSTPDFSYHQNKATAMLTFTALDVPTCVCDDGVQGFINGLVFRKYCASEPTGDLVQQKNPTCWIQTYSGGLSCCHHQNILLDADQPVDPRMDEIYLKFRFWFQDYVPPTETTPASHLNLQRFYFMTEAYAGEYDVVPCPAGIPPQECVQEITAHWQVKDMFWDCDPEKDPACKGTGKGIKLVYAGGHCHAPSCISIELYNLDTGELLCQQTPLFGQGGPDKYDEDGYIAIPPCLWGSEEEGLISPILLTLDTNLMSIKRNNNTYGHYGEMASWQMRGIVL